MENNPNKEKSVDVYSLVTNRIIELLEQGTVPWLKPWTSGGIPRNLLTKRPYQGINLILLSQLGYEHNMFLTWKQIKTIGGSVIKGQKGQFIVFNKMVEKEVGDKVEKKFFLRYYKVFNISQCTDLPIELVPKEKEAISPLCSCEDVIENMQNRPQLVFKENEAYYNPKLDLINMPKVKSFKSIEEYYGVLFHELVHSTGHATRLNRKEVVEKVVYGSEGYSLEELVAEIGSCFIKSYTGISVEDLSQSASYINGWLSVLKNDKRFIIMASSRAQKAVEYILNVKTEHQQSDTEDGAYADALERDFGQEF